MRRQHQPLLRYLLASGGTLRGATLALAYLPHELNGLAECSSVLFHSLDAGATWSNEGASRRDATAHLVSRDYVASLDRPLDAGQPQRHPTPRGHHLRHQCVSGAVYGRWLVDSGDHRHGRAADVKLYDVLGRIIYDQPVANVEVGTSIVSLPGTGQLLAAKYVLVVRQGSQEAHLNVVKQ